jgi:hypothetical protein
MAAYECVAQQSARVATRRENRGAHSAQPRFRGEERDLGNELG